MATDKKSKELYIGATLSYVTTFVSLGVSLILTPIIIRLLGQSDYGLYETIGSFVNYLAVLDLGFGAVVTRYTAKYQNEGDFEKRDKYLYSFRNIYLILCLIVLLIGAIVYNFIDSAFSETLSEEELSKAHLLFIIVLASTVISIYSQIYKGLLNGIELFIWPRVIQLLKAVLTKVMSIAILYWGSDSVGYTSVMLVFEIIACILLAIKAKQYVTFTRNKMPMSQYFELFKFTGYLFVFAIVGQIYWQIDKVVLGMCIGTISVAIYSAALNIENILRNVSSSIKDVLIPRATRISLTDQNSKKILTDFMIKGGRIILMVYGLMLVGITIVGEKFITLWLGTDYLQAVPLMIMLGYGTFIPTILLPGEELCKTFNKHGALSLIYLFVSVLNIVLTVIMVKTIGIYGAAYSTIIGLVLGNVLVSLIYFKRTLGIMIQSLFYGLFHKLTTVLIITLVCGYLIDIYFLTSINWGTLCIEVLLMSIVFISLLFLYGFNEAERKIVSKITKKISK